MNSVAVQEPKTNTLSKGARNKWAGIMNESLKRFLNGWIFSSCHLKKSKIHTLFPRFFTLSWFSQTDYKASSLRAFNEFLAIKLMK